MKTSSTMKKPICFLPNFSMIPSCSTYWITQPLRLSPFDIFIVPGSMGCPYAAGSSYQPHTGTCLKCILAYTTGVFTHYERRLTPCFRTVNGSLHRFRRFQQQAHRKSPYPFNIYPYVSLSSWYGWCTYSPIWLRPVNITNCYLGTICEGTFNSGGA